MAINDAFPYGNGNLSGQAAWSTVAFDGTLAVASNQAVNTLGSTRGNVRTDAWTSAQSSQIQFISGGGFPGVLIHADTGGASLNGYSFGVDLATGDCYLEIRTSGAGSTLDTANVPSFGENSTIRLARESNDVVGYIDDVEVVRATDTTYTSGKPGIFGYTEGTLILDNWTGTGEDTGGGGTETTLTVDKGDLTLTGSAIPFQYIIVESGVASLALTGQNITLTLVDDTDYTITVDAGALTLTGSSVTLSAGASFTLAVDAAALTLAGQNVTLNAIFNVTPAIGFVRAVRRALSRGWPRFGRY